METYLEADLGDLSKALFLSFMRKPGSQSALGSGNGARSQGTLGKDLSSVATTAVAAVMGDAAMAAQGANDSTGNSATTPIASIGKQLGGSIAEKLHGLSERIHQLGHSRHDSGGGGDSGKRSRAGNPWQHAIHQSACPLHFHPSTQ